MAIEKALME
jgi:hypothetical protein